MAPWLMWLLAAVVVLAPVVLLLAFNGSDTADSRGRRLNNRWRS